MATENVHRAAVEETPPSIAGLGVGDLRWMADAYEQAQQVRLQAGERIRALLQGRDDRGVEIPLEDPAVVLSEIRVGTRNGPVPLLGRTYRRHWEQERELRAAMRQVLTGHPAWPWLERVRGIGPTLAGKLLARLDIARAPTPSSFWAYCGLATVPGVIYRCDLCGLEKGYPVRCRVSGKHAAPPGSARCAGRLRPLEGQGEGVRVAQPPPSRGEPSPYDRYAKKVCYLVGASLLRAGGPYAKIYRAERSRLERDRAGWTRGRVHLAALRKTEKLFLSHLWTEWAEAEGMPCVSAYVLAHGDGRRAIRPEEMIEAAPRGAASEP